MLGRLRRRRRIDFNSLPDEDFVIGAYHYLFGMHPDDAGYRNYLDHLRNGTHTRETMLAEMRGTDDYWLQRILDPLISLHLSRWLWMQQLPRAERILDLGGTDQRTNDGALARMGYPYPFERLAIVDLPPETRHDLYNAGMWEGVVETRLGPVEYHHRSMTDLSPFEDDSFDLVVSGQSIEHVTEADADVVLAEAFRVLRPGGRICIDTPNGLACKIQMGGQGVTNPDHEIEYTPAELEAKIEKAGFVIEAAKGLNHIPKTFDTGVFHFDELARFIGIFDDLERCYLLAYQARKPSST
jgi:SAM-dependent methyltransferase